jgi:transcriptional regulator with XRE-family HTH domain
MPRTELDRSTPGSDLRAARERLGITRAQLAGLAGCSYASLGLIEQGACPKRSRVLDRAWQAIAQASATGVLTNGRPAAEASLPSKPAGTGRDACQV